MVFSSLVFLWIFLPIVIVFSLIIRRPKFQNLILLAASLIFYAWGEPRYILLLIISILFNWIFGLLIDRFRACAKGFLALDIIANLGLLGYFKYAGFAADTIRGLFPSLPVPAVSIALPIGISFFTFQAMSYVIDLYRGDCKVQKNVLSLALYISFFPQLIAGPIVKYREIDEQFAERKITMEGFSMGARRFIYGLGKKVIISNLVALGADQIFGMPWPYMSSAYAWIGALLYTLQIYYDFSGYSDMAIGLGRMFGFQFAENFNYPYTATSIRDFWRRWHISLSTWFREYLYIPLGGNRKGKSRTIFNLLVVFFMTGLWHGASWTFVFLGLFHGFFLIIERIGFGKVLQKLKGINWIYTFVIVMVGWVFFRADRLSLGVDMILRMFQPWKYLTSPIPLMMLAGKYTWIAAILGIIGFGPVQMLGKVKNGRLSDLWKGSVAEWIFLAIVLLYSIILMASNTYNPFIYFRF